MIILRQKRFGLIGKLADKLQNKAYKENEDAYNSLIPYGSPKTKEEKRLSRKLIKYAKSRGIDVINMDKGKSYAVDRRGNDPSKYDNVLADNGKVIQNKMKILGQDYKNTNEYKRWLKITKSAMIERKHLQNKGYVNIHGGKTGVGTIGHEVFHIDSDKKFDADNKKFKKVFKISETKPTSRFDALKKSLQIGYNYIPRLREEAKANRGSIKWLKQNGASKPLLKKVKENSRNAFKSYTTDLKYNMLKPIAYYKNSNIMKDTKNKLREPINPVATISQGKAINKAYGKGGKF